MGKNKTAAKFPSPAHLMTQTIEFCKEISQLSNCKSSYLDGDDPMTTLQAFFSYKNIATAFIGANGDSKKGQNNSYVPGD